MAANIPTFQIGDQVAWESQAAGSWKTKIGRVITMPKPGADARTTAGKVQLEVLASYPIDTNADIGLARSLTHAKAGRVFGRANPSSLRALMAAERKVLR